MEPATLPAGLGPEVRLPGAVAPRVPGSHMTFILSKPWGEPPVLKSNESHFLALTHDQQCLKSTGPTPSRGRVCRGGAPGASGSPSLLGARFVTSATSWQSSGRPGTSSRPGLVRVPPTGPATSVSRRRKEEPLAREGGAVGPQGGASPGPPRRGEPGGAIARSASCRHRQNFPRTAARAPRCSGSRGLAAWASLPRLLTSQRCRRGTHEPVTWGGWAARAPRGPGLGRGLRARHVSTQSTVWPLSPFLGAGCELKRRRERDSEVPATFLVAIIFKAKDFGLCDPEEIRDERQPLPCRLQPPRQVGSDPAGSDPARWPASDGHPPCGTGVLVGNCSARGPRVRERATCGVSRVSANSRGRHPTPRLGGGWPEPRAPLPGASCPQPRFPVRGWESRRRHSNCTCSAAA